MNAAVADHVADAQGGLKPPRVALLAHHGPTLLQVHEVQRDGVAVKVVFMDTEGFGAGGNLVTGDPKLAFLATALSSLLYYNVLESINMVRAVVAASLLTFLCVVHTLGWHCRPKRTCRVVAASARCPRVRFCLCACALLSWTGQRALPAHGGPA